MAFFSTFLTTLIEAVILAGIAVAGVFFGKFIRAKKEEKAAKEAGREEQQ